MYYVSSRLRDIHSQSTPKFLFKIKIAIRSCTTQILQLILNRELTLLYNHNNFEIEVLQILRYIPIRRPMDIFYYKQWS